MIVGVPTLILGTIVTDIVCNVNHRKALEKLSPTFGNHHPYHVQVALCIISLITVQLGLYGRITGLMMRTL
jgi:hypothetical protein